jgi:cobalt-zinc-cadmium efflux system membrane fusion protein
MNRHMWTLLVIAAVLGLGTAGSVAWVLASQQERRDEHGHEEHGHEPERDGKADHDGHLGEERDDHANDAREEHAEDEHAEEGVVHLEEVELREFGVETRTAGSGRLGVTLSVPGKVVMPTDRIAHVVPRVPGFARKVLAGLGDRVREGQVMAVLVSTELGTAKVEFLAAEQELHLARTDLERTRTLHDNALRLLDLLAESPSLEELEAVNGTAAGEYRSRLVSAYADLVFARTTYRREKSLYEKKISSGEEFLAAENEYKKALAEQASARDEVAFEIKKSLQETGRTQDVAQLALRAAEQRLHVLGLDEKAVEALAAGKEPEEHLAWYEIRAPVTGVVIEQHITRGEVLGDDTDAYVVADLSSVWVDLSVFPKNVNDVKTGMRVIVSTGDGGVTEGKVTYVSPVVDEETRAGLARVLLPNRDRRWKPGMFVTGELVVSETEVGVMVPKSALQTLEGRPTVFVREGEGFEPRPVSLGHKNELEVEIVAGLQAGEEYVSEGAFALKAHMGKASFGDGHNH